MKRLLLLIILSTFVLPTTIFAEDATPPQNGNHKTYYDSGALKAKERYKNGQLDGAVKYYYEDGKLALETKFKEGKADGIEKTYYPNGAIKREANFKDGVMQGALKLFDPTGRLTDEIAVVDGKREGGSKTFREDQTIEEECQFANDLRISCSYFNEAGILRAKSQVDPNNPQRTIYLTYDDQGNVTQAQQTIEEQATAK